MARRAAERGAEGAGRAHGWLVISPRATTNAYIKPVRRGYSDLLYESPRLDYENREALSAGDEAALMGALERAAQEVDVLCVCDQLKNGCVTGRIRRRVCELARDGLRVIVDSPRPHWGISGCDRKAQ